MFSHGGENLLEGQIRLFCNQSQIQSECSSNGETLPPLRFGAALPVSLQRWHHRITELTTFNLESPGVGASDWRPRHDEDAAACRGSRRDRGNSAAVRFGDVRLEGLPTDAPSCFGPHGLVALRIVLAPDA
jgi:hypothetical protein